MKNPTILSARRPGAATALIPSPPRRTPRTASTRTSSCNVFRESTTASTKPTLRGRTVTLQILGGLWRRPTATTSPALTPIHQEVSRNAVLACRQRGRTSATQIATTATRSATIRTTVPTSKQSVSRISNTDNDSTSSEVDISRRGEEGKCSAHTTRP